MNLFVIGILILWAFFTIGFILLWTTDAGKVNRCILFGVTSVVIWSMVSVFVLDKRVQMILDRLPVSAAEPEGENAR